MAHRIATTLVALLVVPLATGCAVEGAGEEIAVLACEPVGPPVPLPSMIDEASGVAFSRTHPGVIWVVNDGVNGRLFAVDSTGALRAEIPFRLPRGALPLWDVEDMAAGPCGDGDCLYLADVGDNYRIRDTIQVYRVREPELDAREVTVEVFPMVHGEEGRVDIEALLLGDGETVHLLTKGNDEPPSLLRYPGSLSTTPLERPGVHVAERLEEVHRPEGRGRNLARQFTGAARIPGTDRWMVRTYSDLSAQRIVDGRLVELPDSHVSLGPLREPQGEAIAVRDDGLVVLASEAGPFGNVGGLNFIRCEGLTAR